MNNHISSNDSQSILALDVGEKRIGLASASTDTKIAVPYTTIMVDGEELAKIHQIIEDLKPTVIVVGRPRNQSGETTDQTKSVEDFVQRMGGNIRVVYQDESLTSVMAEERLKSQNKSYEKGDIDACAAAIILEDYLEENFGR